MVETTRVFSIKGNLKPLKSENIKYIAKIGLEFEGLWEAKPGNIHVDESINMNNSVDEDGNPRIDRDHNCHMCVKHYFKSARCLSEPETCEENHENHCPDDCVSPLHCDNSCDKGCGCDGGGAHIGETISPPLSIEGIRDWVGVNSPDSVNTSCGLHIHVSMKNRADYIRLMDKEFTEFFVKKMSDWAANLCFPKKHSIWPRINGDNKYCRKRWNANEQAMQTVKNENGEVGKEIRRCQLNFCYNILTEGPEPKPRTTLECRVFPAFKDPAYIMSAIENFIRWVEEYLTVTEGNKDIFIGYKVSVDRNGNFVETKGEHH